MIRKILNEQIQLETVLNTVLDGVITIDSRGIIQSFNLAAIRIFGYEPHEVIGKNVKILMPDPYQSEHNTYINNYLNTGDKKVIGIGREVEAKRKDGTIFSMELGINEMQIDGDRMFVGTIRDITDRKKAKQELLDEATRLQAVMDTVIDGLIIIDDQGVIQSFNPAAERAFGYEADEVTGKNVKALMPEPYHSEHDAYLNNYLTTGDRQVIGIGREVTAKRKDGTTFSMELGINEMQIDGDRMFVGTIRDITDRKKAKQKLLDEATRLQAVMDTVIDGLIIIDDNGIIQSFNPAAERAFGYDAGEVTGKNVKVLMPDPYHSEHDAYLKNYLTTGEKQVIGIGREVTARRKDGSVFPMELGINEMRVNDRRMFVGTIRDITERKIAEFRLKETMADLQLTNEELEKFAYVASHDLKSPLRAIDNLARWLEEDLAGVINNESQEMMQQLRGRIKRMEHLLSDLLEYSRAGRKFTNTEDIDARELINSIGELLDVPADMKIIADASLSEIIVPRMPIEQVFHNLISNAIKHNDKESGKITVSVEVTGKFYSFSVTDNGPGIPANFHKKIFEMFQTLKPRDEVEGSGMGLALVKKIVYRFGGRISVNSEVGKGSQFTFTWPKVIKPELLKTAAS